jgi:hypothetical protein
MASESELTQIVQTIGNKQVEIFDRLRQAEERIEALRERVRELESASARRPSRLARPHG